MITAARLGGADKQKESEVMLIKAETERVVFRHPKGRFIVVERRGVSLLGGEYRIRETRYPSLKRQNPASKPQPPRKQTIHATERGKDQFAKLYRQGYTIYKIAAMNDLAPSTVFKHLSRMGLIRRQKKITAAEKTQIQYLARNGAAYAEIATIVGISKATVCRYVRATRSNS